MSDLDRDPIVRRAIDELRTLPANDPAAIRRVVEAAAAARLMPADDQPVEPRARRGRAWRIAAVASAAAIAGVVVSRTLWRTPEPVQTMAAAAAETSASAHPFAIQPAANAGTELLPIPRQFVLDRGDAKRVALVGDFNEWNPSAAAMTRVGNLWSVTLPIVPGRHMYGFMVDDSLFVLDPRAPKASDSDLGVEGSVIIVGQP
jgi:hypothetical protein